MSEETTERLADDPLRQILARLDSMDARLEILEARAYDTKPIWENALKEITDTRSEMREGLASLRAEMREGFEKGRSDMESSVRKMERKIDVLNQNILDVRADIREVDERLSKLEPEPAK